MYGEIEVPHDPVAAVVAFADAGEFDVGGARAVGVCAHRSPTEGIAVAARVGAAHKGTRVGIDHDALAAADARRPVAEKIELVAAALQLGENLAVNAVFSIDDKAGGPGLDARGLDGGLDIHLVIEGYS